MRPRASSGSRSAKRRGRTPVVTADLRDVAVAARRVIDREEADSRYAHTTHLHVRVAGTVVVDRHLSGPVGPTSLPSQGRVGDRAGPGGNPGSASLAGPAGRRRPASSGRHPTSSGSSTGPPTTQRHDPTGAGTPRRSAPALTSPNRHSAARAGTSTTGLIIRRSWVRAPPAPRQKRRSEACGPGWWRRPVPFRAGWCGRNLYRNARNFYRPVELLAESALSGRTRRHQTAASVTGRH